MFKCKECGNITIKLHKDTHVPPLNTENCLCYSCFEIANEKRIEELEQEIENIRNAWY